MLISCSLEATLNNKMIAPLLVVATLGLGLTGCAQNPYGNAYSVGDARQVQTVLTGTITKLDAVTIQGDAGNTIGTLAGGAIGALLVLKLVVVQVLILLQLVAVLLVVWWVVKLDKLRILVRA